MIRETHVHEQQSTTSKAEYHLLYLFHLHDEALRVLTKLNTFSYNDRVTLVCWQTSFLQSLSDLFETEKELFTYSSTSLEGVVSIAAESLDVENDWLTWYDEVSPRLHGMYIAHLMDGITN